MHLRTRRRLKNLGVTMSLLIVLLTLSNLWLSWGIGFHYGAVGFEHGDISIYWIGDGPKATDEFGLGFGYTPDQRGIAFSLPTIHKIGLIGLSGWKWWHWQAVIPLWLVLLCTLTPTAILAWRDRTPPRGFCTKCGYNLTGNVSGRCPERGDSTIPGELL